MKTKNFDAIIMKRKAQEKIYNKIKELSEKELLEYWSQFKLKSKKSKTKNLS